MPRKSPPSGIKSREPAGSKAAWSGRFAEPVSERVKRYTASVGFDRRLAAEDVRGSLAHARMLAASGIITRRDLAAIERGMKAIGREIRAGSFDMIARLARDAVGVVQAARGGTRGTGAMS